jgi:hypothetical protein
VVRVLVEPSLEFGDRYEPAPADPGHPQVRDDVLVEEVD